MHTSYSDSGRRTLGHNLAKGIAKAILGMITLLPIMSSAVAHSNFFTKAFPQATGSTRHVPDMVS